MGFFAALGPLGLLATGFWIWMIYDCVQNERDRHIWLWLLIFLHGIGAAIYFVARWLPRSSIPVPASLGRWTKRDELWQAEAAAKNIGKPTQFIKLGNILHQIGDLDKAADAYQQALAKEPENLDALWGYSTVEIDRKKLSAARAHLQTLMELKPDFKYGDASVIYGRVLYELGDLEAAKAHLEGHFKSWGSPEAYVLMAKVHHQQGNIPAAREALETMIIKVKGSPPYYYRQNRHFVGQGERMLRTLQ
ncbi:MAG: tetratricopeptide repeat protein [Leptolyngbyaceae cyanobacterium MO_188.B28]|nr:tetratricopeptide repeat protein [Leptolyngbyaceae cyanobacterium MO_188.B28]